MRRTGAFQVVKARHLRFVTLNLWGENGPWESRLDLVSDTLAGVLPDVVALQEVREASGRIVNQAETLARRRGWNHVFAPSTAWGGGNEGLAILSRFPIGAHDFRPLPHSLENEGRIVLSARIDSDFGEVWAHTTHLAFREHEGRKREDQVLVVDEVVAAHKNDNPQVLMGDFNAVPHSDEIRWLSGLTTLSGRRVYYQDAWDMIHPNEAGYTWSRDNHYRERMHWLRADRRLDYVFVTPTRRDRRGTVHEARLIFETPMVMAGGERLFASDHFGVLAEVQFLAEDPDAATQSTYSPLPASSGS
ncbi:MAG TPA: endonuclease/exonuclease/phosphatase family protein [Polyangia bacterium]|nr:endonuclease/exonuclease/phosphatase family protein [Polyangia bacterium]